MKTIAPFYRPVIDTMPDVALPSTLHHPEEILAVHWCLEHAYLERNLDRLRDVHFVRCEDLYNRPEDALRDLTAYLEVPWDDGHLHLVGRRSRSVQPGSPLLANVDPTTSYRRTLPRTSSTGSVRSSPRSGIRSTGRRDVTVSGAALFLTGLPRSGTTWVGRVLTADPHVFRIDEPFNPKTRQWLPIDYPSRYLEPDVPLVIPAALRRAVDGMLNLRFRVPRQPELRNRRQLLRDLGALSRFVEAKARRSTVVVKDPTANFLASWLHDEFGARPVVLVRHPCGNAAGYLRMGWSGLPYLERPGPAAQFRPSDRTYVEPYRHAVAGDPILSAALDWRLTNGMLLGWRERVPDLVVVRYEELADDPATSFPSLAGRLGLPWGRHNEVTLNELRGAAVDHAALGSKLHVMNREPRAAAWSWRDRLAKDQIDAVLEHAGALAAELGYGP